MSLQNGTARMSIEDLLILLDPKRAAELLRQQEKIEMEVEMENVSRNRIILAASAGAPPGLVRASEMGLADRLTDTETKISNALGLTPTEAVQARALAPNGAPKRAAGPRVTAEDREIGRHLNLSEDQMVAAAQLRFERFGT